MYEYTTFMTPDNLHNTPHASLGPRFEASTATTVTLDGRSLVSFAGCNYMGLAHDPLVMQAAADAIARFGLSTSASRRTSGHTALHAALEHDIAALLGLPAALLLPDGYTANLAALQALRTLGHTHALIDSRAHQSMRDAAKLAGLTIHTFATADAEDARYQLRTLNHNHTVILTDGIFTTDGRRAPLDLLMPLDATLLVDDCHGFGIVGPAGAGTAASFGLGTAPNLVVTSTLAKGIGCAGGFIAGSAAFVRSATQSSSAFVCTTPASPPLVAAATEALRIARTDQTRTQQLSRNIEAIRATLRSFDIVTHDEATPIFAFTTPPGFDPSSVSKRMIESGIYLPLMDYPHGPAPRFFRLSVSAQHCESDIQALRHAMHDAWPVKSGVPSAHV